MVMHDMRSELEHLLDEAGPDASIGDVLARAAVPDWQKSAIREAWRVEEHYGTRIVEVAKPDAHEDFRDMEDFVATVGNASLREELERALQGRGAFRKFRNVIHSEFREKEQWFEFKRARLRQHVTEWLTSFDIEPEWVMPEALATVPPRPPVRVHLLEGVLRFVRAASQFQGVKRIALIGSLATEEHEPKDADLLVTISDDMDLRPLAKAGRRLAGCAQQLNRGADVFLASEDGRYVGRTCAWRECGPGIRQSCDALHCGQRHYLHDDLRTIKLGLDLISKPPIELWPVVQARVATPADVETLLLTPLRTGVT
jgi:predicted nucleotidyltransferase